MALTLTIIDPDTSIGLGPATLNANFAAIQAIINQFENKLIIATNTLKLTNLTSIPNDSIEAATITLTKTTGDVIVVAPGGGAAVYKVDSAGAVTALKITAVGVGADKSTLGELDVLGLIALKEKVTVEKVLDLRSANTIVTSKITQVAILNANIGGAASNPLDISKDNRTLINADNGGAALTGSKDIKIDTTTLQEGQEVYLRLLKDNVGNGVKFYNGTSGNEVFAKIDPTSLSGFVNITFSVLPEFDSATNNECWLLAKWMQISVGVFRLVVLEYKNVLNVA